MKTLTNNTRSLALGVTLIGSLLSSATAAVVIEIDLSNPNSIEISATGAFSSTDSTLGINSNGFTIENFFTSAVTYPNTTTFTGNLSPSGTTDTYSGLGTFEYDDNDGVFKAGNDLSVYKNGSGGNQVFSTMAIAFSGIATIDFSATTGALPMTVGATGNVISGFFKSGTADHGEVIGQWRVVATNVPEPSSTLLLGLAGLTLLGRRSRKD